MRLPLNVTRDFVLQVTAAQSQGQADPLENLTPLEKRLFMFFEDQTRFGCQHNAAMLVTKLLTDVDVKKIRSELGAKALAIPPGTKIQDGTALICVSNKSGHGLSIGSFGVFKNASDLPSRLSGRLVSIGGQARGSHYDLAAPRDFRLAYPHEILKAFGSIQQISTTVSF